jgi:hypothetical protein
MQKNLFLQYITMAAVLLLAGSCKKLIQIPPAPPNAIEQSDQFVDSASTMAAVSQVYSYTAYDQPGFGYADAVLTETTGLSSDELSYVSTSDANLPSFYTYGLSATNGDVNGLWTAAYTALYVVNAVLSGVNSSAGLTPSFKAQITGEMEVTRALYYFNNLNLWGAVPLATTTNYQVNAVLARSPVDSVYDQIVTDLTNAQQNLTAAYPSSGHARPNLYAADALLAKTYLYLQQWQNAYNAANAVISSGVYSLVSNPNQVFLDGSTEAIWQIPATGPFVVTMEAQSFIPGYPGATPSFLITPWLLKAFEPGDLRKLDWMGNLVVNGDTLNYPYKYKNLLTTSATVEDYMVLRLAELYLIRAEASAELGNGAAALADVNIVRARAGLAASTANPASNTAVLSAIMHERQVELFTEWGNRWYDLKRTGTAATVLGAEKTGYTADAALYPIPQSQQQSDVYLTQNPGY